MRKNRVKQLWREGKPVHVGWCGSPDPYIAEIMVRGGFDAVVLDMQHGMGNGPDRAAIWLQIIGQTDSVPFVRLPWNEPYFAQWVLDAGALGIIVPLVNTVEEAKKAIGAVRYPPRGYRSNGPNRARFAHADYARDADDEIALLLMMETEEGISNQEEIAKLPDLDGYYVGPADLARSLGLPPAMDVQEPRHVELVQRVVDVARAHGQVAGIHPGSTEEAVRRYRQGFNFNPIGSDVQFVSAGISRGIATFREGTSGEGAAAPAAPPASATPASGVPQAY